jgi:hypothetical protein
MAAMLAIFPAGAAYATEGVLAGDAYVISSHPAINYGSLSNLYVNGNGTALLQFDLSALPAGTTASQIGSARLKLDVDRLNAITGLALCQFDTPTTAEDFVVVNSYNNGFCSDGGTAYPTSGQGLGIVLAAQQYSFGWPFPVPVLLFGGGNMGH